MSMYDDELEYSEEEPELKHPLLEMLGEGNIVAEIDKDSEAEARIKQLYEDAVKSMGPWLRKYKEALYLAKMQPYHAGEVMESKDFPFKSSSMDMLPFVMEACLDFHGRATPELVWARNIMKVKVYGAETGKMGQPTQDQAGEQKAPPTPEETARAGKESRAKRVAEYSNYQLRKGIPYWRDDQDKMLLALPCVGTAYKETYYDHDVEDLRSDLLLADEVIFNHGVKRFEEAPDKFIKLKLSRNEVMQYIRGDQQWQIDESDVATDVDEFNFLKCFTWVDVDQDGIREPYIVIINEDTDKPVYMIPHFDEDTLTLNDDGDVIKIEAVKRFTQYRFLPDPQFGPMGMGWGILLGESFASANTMLRQQLDAATMQITAGNSGLIEVDTTTGRGNALTQGVVEVEIGTLTPVATRGTRSLSDSVFQFPARGPSQELHMLLEYLTTSLRDMATTTTRIEAQTNEAATLYLARLQQALKVPNSIIMRVYGACEREFDLLFNLNYEYYDDDTYNKVIDAEKDHSMRDDFNPHDCDISMVANPTEGSDIERVARSEAILDRALSQGSNILDARQAYEDWLNSMNTPNVEKLMPPPRPDPQVQAMARQAQVETEMKANDQKLRHAEIEMKRMKLAHESAIAMAEMGLADEKMLSEIANNYASALEKFMKMGLSPDESLDIIENDLGAL